MPKQVLKQNVCQHIEAKKEVIYGIGEQIMKTPELGFKEFNTARLVAGVMNEYGLAPETGLAITGVKGILRGKDPGPTVAILGELDALTVPDHPAADPQTGAAHACGHNSQIAAMLGAMIGLVKAKVHEQMAGHIVFFAVPAEEYIEVAYRQSLIREGKLGLLGGKPELIRLGHFNDIDMALLMHSHSRNDVSPVIMGKSSNGCVVKMVRFLGRAAHAGQVPHLGINALNAAQIALAAINAQRETFQDRDTIRVHPIITKGGDVVNVVPAEVCLETFVRGKTNPAIADAEKKVDRALRAGAMAVGAKVEIMTLPGYMPLANHKGLARVFQSNVGELLGPEAYLEGGHGTGSTDMGDLSRIMPVIHPVIGGATGAGHSADWKIEDRELNMLTSAKLMALTALDLLCDGAQRAESILADFKPEMSVEEYVQYQEKIFRTELYDPES